MGLRPRDLVRLEAPEGRGAWPDPAAATTRCMRYVLRPCVLLALRLRPDRCLWSMNIHHCRDDESAQRMADLMRRFDTADADG